MGCRDVAFTFQYPSRNKKPVEVVPVTVQALVEMLVTKEEGGPFVVKIAGVFVNAAGYV